MNKAGKGKVGTIIGLILLIAVIFWLVHSGAIKAEWLSSMFD